MIHNQLIGIYENVLPKEWCNDIIKIFENNKNFQRTRKDESSQVRLAHKQDVHLPPAHIPPHYIEYFYEVFKTKILSSYREQYPTFEQILEVSDTQIMDFKIQKTLPGEGYHIWHFENIKLGEHINRILAWIVYLNDVEEGGETEFLFQSLRIPPKKGTVTIWPAGYYHTHRGNPPLSGEKYIITGWIELLPENINEILRKNN